MYERLGENIYTTAPSYRHTLTHRPPLYLPQALLQTVPLVVSGHNRWPVSVVQRKIAVQLAQGTQRLHVVCESSMCHSRERCVRVSSSQLLLRHVLHGDGLDHIRSRDKHMGRALDLRGGIHTAMVSVQAPSRHPSLRTIPYQPLTHTDTPYHEDKVCHGRRVDSPPCARPHDHGDLWNHPRGVHIALEHVSIACQGVHALLNSAQTQTQAQDMRLPALSNVSITGMTTQRKE